MILLWGLGSAILTLIYFIRYITGKGDGDILLVNSIAAAIFIVFFTVLLTTIHC